MYKSIERKPETKKKKRKNLVNKVISCKICSKFMDGSCCQLQNFKPYFGIIIFFLKILRKQRKNRTF